MDVRTLDFIFELFVGVLGVFSFLRASRDRVLILFLDGLCRDVIGDDWRILDNSVFTDGLD